MGPCCSTLDHNTWPGDNVCLPPPWPLHVNTCTPQAVTETLTEMRIAGPCYSLHQPSTYHTLEM